MTDSKKYNHHDLSQIDVSMVIQKILEKGESDETALIESVKIEILNKQLERLSYMLSCTKDEVIYRAIYLYEIAYYARKNNKKITFVDEFEDDKGET